MKKNAVSVLLAVLCLAAASTAMAYDRYGDTAPPPRHAQHGQTYLFGHVGFYDPNDEAPTATGGGLGGYNTGGSFDVGMGSRVTDILAIEGAVGGFYSDRGPDKVRVSPLTFGMRLIIPHQLVEPYVGAGVGMYFADLQEGGINDSATTFGGYASLGLDAWLNPRIALNLEGKYHFVKPEFNGIDVDVSGWTFGMGVRVAF